MAVPTADPKHRPHRARHHRDDDDENPTPGNYSAVRYYHKRAYEHLSRALEIDELGAGEKAAAIDYYSKGVAELEAGISCEVTVEGEEAERIEKLKQKMLSNLDMARERVTALLSGGSLKGEGGSPSRPAPEPTESLRVFPKDPHKKAPTKPKTTVPSTTKRNPASTYSTNKPPSKRDNHPVDPASSSKKKATDHPPSHMKGVDSKLAQKILDELVEDDTSVTWDDIVGLQLPKRTLQEIVILPSLRPELFTGLRSPARGLLLFGPPGNGKTMLAKAVANESMAKFFNVSASSLTSKWVGEGEKLVKALFALARELQPSIIFLDEVDALLNKRGESEHDAMRRIKNEFLQAFDGMTHLGKETVTMLISMHTTEGERILVMAATNRPQELDDAALRRFQKRIFIPLPEAEARKMILKKLLSKHKNNISEAELNALAKLTEGYSASDLTALAKDAALGPIRELDYEMLKSVPANKVRPLSFNDFQHSMRLIRSSVSPELLQTLETWNSNYGVSS